MSNKYVKKLFEREELPRPPFIPWVCTFAAKLWQIPVKQMLTDPTKSANLLQNTQKLLGYDGIVNIFDSSVEAEACGCRIEWKDNKLPEVVSHPLEEGKNIEDLDISEIEKRGRIPVVMEATKRLSLVMGKEVGMIGAVTGPLTLARHLKGSSFLGDLENNLQEAEKVVDFTGKIALGISKIYCELRMDAIVVIEEMLHSMDASCFDGYKEVLGSMWNVIRYYKAHPIVLIRRCSEDQIEKIFQLEADGVAIGEWLDLNYLKNLASRYNQCFAGCIPSSVFLGSREEVKNTLRRYLGMAGKKGFFLTGEWEIPYETPVENIKEIMNFIKM